MGPSGLSKLLWTCQNEIEFKPQRPDHPDCTAKSPLGHLVEEQQDRGFKARSDGHPIHGVSIARFCLLSLPHSGLTGLLGMPGRHLPLSLSSCSFGLEYSSCRKLGPPAHLPESLLKCLPQ